MDKTIRLLRLTTMWGILVSLLICGGYLLAVSYQEGQFPPALTDSKWRPFRPFRPIVGYSMYFVALAIIPHLILFVISLIKKKWRPKRQEYVL